MNALDQIKSAITDYSAIAFAEAKLESSKTVPDYYSYMRALYSGKDNPTIEECEQNALAQFLNEYEKCCAIYRGWLSNGKVFILDRRKSIVLALYKKDKLYHGSIVHYNPMNVDLLEASCPNDMLFKGLENGDFDLSTDEVAIIKECDALIKQQQVVQ